MKWTEEEVQMLRKGYETWPPNITNLAIALNKTKPCVKMKAAHLGLCKHQALKAEEIKFIKTMAVSKSITHISLMLGRSWNTIRMTLRLNGIKPFKPSNKWIPSDIEIQYMKENQGKPLKILSAYLKRSMPAIAKQMKAMGWMRPRVIKLKPLGPPLPPRVKKEKIAKKSAEKLPDVPRDGINRIREAMERINRI